MKIFIYTLLAMCFFSSNSFAQAPDLINYQAVARNSTGGPIQNQVVGVKISILQGSATGTAVYEETHAPTTDNYGAFNLQIGGGTVVTGSFAGINWGSFANYLKVEMDITGGTNYVPMGTSQMVSVPYAKYAEKAGSVTGGGASGGGKPFILLTGAVTDAQAAAIIANDVGSNTQTIRIMNTTALTTVDLSNLVNVESIQIANNTALTSIDLSNLEVIYGNLIIFDDALGGSTSISLPKVTYSNAIYIDNDYLTSFSAPLMTVAGGIGLESTSLTSLDLSNLKDVLNGRTDNDLVSGLSLYDAGLTAINLPKLENAYTFFVRNCNSLTSLSIPLLKTGSIYIQDNASLPSVSLPSLTSVDFYESTLYIKNNSVLTSISIPVLTTFGTYSNDFSGNKLSSTTVNALLAKMVAASPALTSSYIYLNGQTPAAPPTGQGLTDKTTLSNAGNTVTTD
ncbi:MAG: hypothetical protein GY810_29590 [Aureispira sp.]|nr:hypothetical protein [Aureispira sp.]